MIYSEPEISEKVKKYEFAKKNLSTPSDYTLVAQFTKRQSTLIASTASDLRPRCKTSRLRRAGTEREGKKGERASEREGEGRGGEREMEI